jgi:hypothetical protein
MKKYEIKILEPVGMRVFATVHLYNGTAEYATRIAKSTTETIKQELGYDDTYWTMRIFENGN